MEKSYAAVRIIKEKDLKKVHGGTSLVEQWTRIHLPMQGTQIWSLAQEDSTCCRATKPPVPQILSLHSRPHRLQQLGPRLQLLKPVRIEHISIAREATSMRSLCTSKNSPHLPQVEKAPTQQWTPSKSKNK